MHKFHRHRHAKFAHPGQRWDGLIWPIGLLILFVTGMWWPGILVLVGLSMILNAVSAKTPFPDFVQDEFQAAPAPVSPPPPAAAAPAPVAETPARPMYRVDLLPQNCPHCGGPARAGEVKWASAASAACAYCGSILPMKP